MTNHRSELETCDRCNRRSRNIFVASDDSGDAVCERCDRKPVSEKDHVFHTGTSHEGCYKKGLHECSPKGRAACRRDRYSK